MSVGRIQGLVFLDLRERIIYDFTFWHFNDKPDPVSCLNLVYVLRSGRKIGEQKQVWAEIIPKISPKAVFFLMTCVECGRHVGVVWIFSGTTKRSLRKAVMWQHCGTSSCSVTSRVRSLFLLYVLCKHQSIKSDENCPLLFILFYFCISRV